MASRASRADQGLPGQVKSVTDEQNGDTTSNLYDAFGRRRQVFRPGDTGNPTQIIHYFEGDLTETWAGPRFMRVVFQKAGEEEPLLWRREFYDGLGRLVQTQGPAEDWVDTGGGQTTGKDIVQYRVYDELGAWPKSHCPSKWTPTIADPDVTPYQAPGGQPGTTTTYDALDRPLVGHLS